MAYKLHNYQIMKEGMTRLQAVRRSRKHFSEFVRIKKASMVVSRLVFRWLYRLRQERRRVSILRLQRWAQCSIGKLHFRRLRRGIQSVHLLARSFVIREQVNRMLDALLMLQRVCRKYITRLEVHRITGWLALRVQAWARGRFARIACGGVVEELKAHRIERKQQRQLRRIQGHWRALMVRTRFMQIRQSACLVQQWTRAKIGRQQFVAQRCAAIWIQSYLRGMKARNQSRELVTTSMCEDEHWRVVKVREREALQIAKMHDSDLSENTPTAARQGSYKYALADVDMMVDTSDIYPDGWVSTFSDLEKMLTHKGKRVVSMAVGASHTVVMTDAGEAYTWGWGDHGQLGHGGYRNELNPRCVETLLFQVASFTRTDEQASKGARSTVRIKEIAAGDDFTVALSESGRVYTWGSGKRGQLGLGNFKSCANPRVIDSLKRRVTAIACGSHFACCIGEPGTVYAWGVEKHLGQGPAFEGHGNQATPHAVNISHGGRKRRALFVDCGRSHVVVCTHHGELFSWGDNQYGQLGLGHRSNTLTPTKLDTGNPNPSQADRLVGISCGARHTLAFSTNRVMVWGSNKFGQLGLGDTEDRLEPEAIEHLEIQGKKISQVAAGWRHSVCLTTLGELFAWGHTSAVSRDGVDLRNSNDNTSVVTLTPKPMPLPNKFWRAPNRVQCSWSHTLASTGITFAQMNLDGGGALRTRSSATTSQSDLVSQVHSIILDGKTDKGGPNSPNKSTARRMSALLSPEQLSAMDPEQIKAMAANIQGQGSPGKHYHESHRLRMKKEIAESKTQAEIVHTWGMRGALSEDPINNKREKEWDSNHSGRRDSAWAPRIRAKDKEEIRKMQTTPKLTKFGTSRNTSFGVGLAAPSGDFADTKGLHPDLIAAVGGSGSPMVEMDPSSGGTSQAQAEGEARRKREMREGKLSGMSGMFAPSQLVTAMGGTTGAQDAVAKQLPRVQFDEIQKGLSDAGTPGLSTASSSAPDADPTMDISLAVQAAKETAEHERAETELDAMNRFYPPSGQQLLPHQRRGSAEEIAKKKGGRRPVTDQRSNSVFQLEEEVEQLRLRLESSRRGAGAESSRPSPSKQTGADPWSAPHEASGSPNRSGPASGEDSDLLSMIDRIKKQATESESAAW